MCNTTIITNTIHRFTFSRLSIPIFLNFSPKTTIIIHSSSIHNTLTPNVIFVLLNRTNCIMIRSAWASLAISQVWPFERIVSGRFGPLTAPLPLNRIFFKSDLKKNVFRSRSSDFRVCSSPFPSRTLDATAYCSYSGIIFIIPYSNAIHLHSIVFIFVAG